MKNFSKVFLCIFLVIVICSAVIVGPYAISFLPFKTDEDFDISKGTTSFNMTNSIKKVNDDGSLDLEGILHITPTETKSDLFNYYGISYTSDSYLKGTLTYKKGVKEVSEDFFLEPSKKETAFYSFIDGCLDGEKGRKVISLTFECIDKENCKVNILGFSVFNREIPEQEIFIQNDTHKLGIDLLWGGALSYLEDLDSNVQAVSVDGKIKVDSNASDRYNAESVNNNVNLINRNDTGRLVQQSYYGTIEYDHGVYMENDWRYNPVQGGNQFNDASKIVDLRVTENSIYIKCRPLDWAKEKEYITPSYMEATYSLENGAVHAKCRFVDFSGYPEAEATQEIPAFYCIEPLNNFVYYGGDKPWTNGKLTNEPDLIFWPDAGYPNFYSKENWSAFTGEFEDSFGIGVYVDNEEAFLAGVFEREKTTNEDPSKDGPTSYIAIVKNRIFKSFDPYQYEYYLATGDTTEIRNTFEKIDR
ncbi:MAG: hypothetical protein E7529_00340 [Ruminococcaceae bacterium]|nr:hypothetical protein [Oscillospiraceae bacterium]